VRLSSDACRLPVTMLTSHQFMNVTSIPDPPLDRETGEYLTVEPIATNLRVCSMVPKERRGGMVFKG